MYILYHHNIFFINRILNKKFKLFLYVDHLKIILFIYYLYISNVSKFEQSHTKILKFDWTLVMRSLYNFYLIISNYVLLNIFICNPCSQIILRIVVHSLGTITVKHKHQILLFIIIKNSHHTHILYF